MEEIKAGIMRIAPITRYYLISVFAISFLTTYKLLSPYALILDLESAVYRI